MQFPWRWNGGTIFLNLGVIWGMPVIGCNILPINDCPLNISCNYRTITKRKLYLSMLKSFYQKIPIPAQHLACTLYCWNRDRKRFGSEFDDLLAEAENRWNWSTDRLIAFRNARLRNFIQHAAATVPYYRKLFAEKGIDPDGIHTMDDLKAIPILSKTEAVRLGSQLRSRAIPSRSLKMTETSGTTGAGFRFATTIEADREQWVVWWRHWRSHGIRMATWNGIFGTKPLVPLKQQAPPFWRYDFAARQIYFSAHHMTEQFLPHYVQEIRNRRLAWIHGRPSTLSLIAAYMLDSGDTLDHPVRWITCAMEQLFHNQAAMIEKAFGVAPVQHYGVVEATANISQSPNGLHRVDEDFAAVEFIPADDNGDWRIIGTNFTNLATPLIRYDIGDKAKLESGASLNTESIRSIISFEGRWPDFVVLADGRQVAGLDRMFKNIDQIKEAKIIQSTPGRIRIDVVKRPDYSQHDEERLRKEVRSQLGADIKLDIKYVSTIERSPSGKFQLVESALANESWSAR
jgi:phenylacetate-CoA ligase